MWQQLLREMVCAFLISSFRKNELIFSNVTILQRKVNKKIELFHMVIFELYRVFINKYF